MANTCTYLNFPRQTEEVFLFYRSIFGGEFNAETRRFRDMPAAPGQDPIAEEDLDLIVHIELGITGGHILMGTDAPESMGFKINMGNNMHIMLLPDDKNEADRLFNSLCAGGSITMPMQDMFWGAYFGSCTDKYGVQWMVNISHANIN